MSKAPDDYLDEEYVDLDWQPPKGNKQKKVEMKRSQESASANDLEGSGEGEDDEKKPETKPNTICNHFWMKE